MDKIKNTAKLKREIECQYAFIQSFYCAGSAIITGFSTVYLISKGLPDGTISLVNAVVLLTTMLAQAVIACFSDHHAQTPLKYIISTLCVISIAGAVLLFRFPLAPAALVIAYITMSALFRGCDSLLNALFVQHISGGLAVNFGWPRGFGSVFHALMAFALGVLIEEFGPDAMLLVFILLGAGLILFVLRFPKPAVWPRSRDVPKPAVWPRSRDVPKPAGRKTSYFGLLRGNPTLLLFILAIALQNMGEIPSFTYLIRIVEPLGGNTATLGICLLIEGLMESPMLFLSAFLLRKRRPVFWLLVSSGAYLVRCCAFVFAPVMGVVYFGEFINILCNGLLCFASVLFVDSIVEDGDRVQAQALVVLGRLMGMMAGSFFVGCVFDIFGFDMVKGICVAASAAGMMLMLLFFFSVKKWFPEQTLPPENAAENIK